MKFDLMRCVSHKKAPNGAIYLDLWDDETKTNVELTLTFRENVRETAYNYFNYLMKTESQVDPVKIMIFLSLVNKEKNSFTEALVKIGGSFD